MNEYFTLCNTRRAHVNEFFTLAQQILQAAKEMLAETEAQPRIATYESAVTAFDEALKQSTKNSYTASVELADEADYRCWYFGRCHIDRAIGAKATAVYRKVIPMWEEPKKSIFRRGEKRQEG